MALSVVDDEVSVRLSDCRRRSRVLQRQVIGGGDVEVPSSRPEPEVVVVAARAPAVTMTIYNLWLFDERGTCLYYREWNRPVAASDVKQNQKLKLKSQMVTSFPKI